MVTVMLTHEVKDFNNWKKHFDDGEEMRTNAGFTVTGLYRNNDNANIVTVTTEATSVDAVNAFLANPALKEAMELGGVISAPELKILNRVN